MKTIECNSARFTLDRSPFSALCSVHLQTIECHSTLRWEHLPAALELAPSKANPVDAPFFGGLTARCPCVCWGLYCFRKKGRLDGLGLARAWLAAFAQSPHVKIVDTNP